MPRILCLLMLLIPVATPGAVESLWLDELDVSLIGQGWGQPQPRRSVEKNPILLNGERYRRGVGSHAPGSFYVQLDGNATRFQAAVGIDDEVGANGSARVRVHADGNLVADTGVLRGGQAPAILDIPLEGVELLLLVMTDGGDDRGFDHVDFADARFSFTGDPPELVPYPPEERVILTPPPPKAPRINGPRVYGVRPGSPFLFRIPTTGERPIQFSAENLPEGLRLDASKGILSGRIADQCPRTWHTTLVAENSHGRAEREFRIAAGDTIALTPPMGWNHWYAHYDRITDAMMREAADIMVSSGMADVGYQYVNIDDCWMNTTKLKDPKRVGPFRDENGDILPNAHFPDMRGLTAHIHAYGLKAGLYTSPGETTCAGFAGAWGHERQDAEQFAEWGFDFLKYDWCSYEKKAKDHSRAELMKPYIKMGGILKTLGRDIVFNLCQYGMGEVWEWGAETGGHCWRTAGDLGFELRQYHEVARRNAAYHEHARPGAWNDPDYLQIGYVGKAAGMGAPKPCPLSPNEQYSYMSLWCLMAAPLVYSGDMTRLDPFTLNVLCNPEVIDIDQDPLGKQGHPVARKDATEVWRKELENGDIAAGLFNLDEVPRTVTATWENLEITGERRLRDLWRHKDLGVHNGEFSAEVPRHGVLLVRMSKPDGGA